MDNPQSSPLLHSGDPGAALALLTRLPAPFAAHDRGAAAAWAWPLAGLAAGGLAAVVAGLAHWAGLGPGPQAALALVALALVTGGLHHDGLADFADGVWGGRDPARRLEIMRDSRVGSYGVLALVLVPVLGWSALVQIAEKGLLAPALLIGAAGSRAAMAGVMAALPPARTDGLSRLTGRPGLPTVLLALGVGALPTVLLAPSALLPVLLVSAGLAALVARIARKALGGQTGDVLGATQMIAETGLWLTLVALT